jgi:hypothetical protein
MVERRVQLDAIQTLYFGTNGAERARITAAGDLLVGKTAVSNTTKGATISPSGEVQVTITNAGGWLVNVFS